MREQLRHLIVQGERAPQAVVECQRIGADCQVSSVLGRSPRRFVQPKTLDTFRCELLQFPVRTKALE